MTKEKSQQEEIENKQQKKAKPGKEFLQVSKEELKSVKGITNLKKVFKLVSFNKGIFALLCILAVIRIGLNIFFALIAKEGLAILSLPQDQYYKLYYVAAISLSAGVLIYITDYIFTYYLVKMKNEMSLSLQNALFDRINNLKATCFANNQTSTFTQRIGEANAIVRDFDYLFNQIQGIITTVAHCVILVTVSPILFASSFLFYLVKALLYRYIIPRHIAIQKKNREIHDKSRNLLMESIRGASDTKSLNLYDTLREDFAAKEALFQKNNLTIGLWWRNRLMPTNFFTYEIGGAVFIALVAFLGTNSFYATATFLYFWSYRGQINGLFNRFFEIKDRLADCELSSARMMELYDEKRFPVESFGKNEMKKINGTIKFENVEFAYETKKKILDGISFTIKPNSITAIVGKTGCGKSTTLSLIARFNDASKGKITIDGKNITSLTKNALRKNIAYVQQNPYIFNRSFKGNLLLVKPDATEEEIIDACKKAEIHDFITTTENGYDTIIGENGITLSGGQRQRLAIARALINNSKIIMFDESTSSLDNENQAKIQSVIEKLSADHTIIVVAHRLSTIINADNILFMDDHKIHAEGTHKELFENCEAYRDLYQIENI